MGKYPEMEAIVRALIRAECPTWSPNLGVALFLVVVALVAALAIGYAWGHNDRQQ